MGSMDLKMIIYTNLKIAPNWIDPLNVRSKYTRNMPLTKAVPSTCTWFT